MEIQFPGKTWCPEQPDAALEDLSTTGVTQVIPSTAWSEEPSDQMAGSSWLSIAGRVSRQPDFLLTNETGEQNGAGAGKQWAVIASS